MLYIIFALVALLCALGRLVLSLKASLREESGKLSALKGILNEREALLGKKEQEFQDAMKILELAVSYTISEGSSLLEGVVGAAWHPRHKAVVEKMRRSIEGGKTLGDSSKRSNALMRRRNHEYLRLRGY